MDSLEVRGIMENPDPYGRRLPVYTLIIIAIQIAVEALASPTQNGDIIGYVRLASVVFNLLTLVFIALTARTAANNVAGWIAGLLWGLSPTIVSEGVYVQPDPLTQMLGTLALWLAAEALINEKRRHWMIWSMVVASIVFLTKWHPVTVILPALAVSIYFLCQNPKANWRYVLFQALVFIPPATYFAFQLIQVLFFREVYREGAEVRYSGIQNFLDYRRIGQNISTALSPLDLTAFLIFCSLALILLVATKNRKHLHLGVLGLSAIQVITVPWVASAFRVGIYRDVLLATACATILLGVAVSYITSFLPKAWPQAVPAVASLALMLPVYIPQVRGTWAVVQDRRLPDSRVDLRQWFDINLDPGTVIVTRVNHKTFNPYWGGMQGRKWFDWWETENIMEHPVSEWRNERGMSYAVLPLSMVQEMESTEEGRAYLAEMLHLRDFAGGPPHRGPEMSVFRLWRMQVETQIQFGDSITLIGYDQDTAQAVAGGTLTFRFYWVASAPPPENYSVFVHLMPLDAVELITQSDGNPAVPERLTMTWTDPDETLISPPFTLTLPASMAEGQYRVMIGLYNYLTGVRLPVTDRITGETLGDAYQIAVITVDK